MTMSTLDLFVNVLFFLFFEDRDLLESHTFALTECEDGLFELSFLGIQLVWLWFRFLSIGS